MLTLNERYSTVWITYAVRALSFHCIFYLQWEISLYECDKQNSDRVKVQIE